MINPEANEISQEDLEAAASTYDAVMTEETLVNRIVKIAKDQYDVVLSAESIDRIASRYACRPDGLAECIAYELGALRAYQRPTPPKKQPFTVCVKMELYYEIPAENLPEFSTPVGVEKLVEEAFDDYNRPLSLSDLGTTGVLKLDPTEISIGTILSA